MTNSNGTVREIALSFPQSIRVFEQLGIDYCCGGRRPLAEACAEHNLDLDQVLASLEKARQQPTPSATDWSRESLTSLVQHIVDTHHAYVRRELPRLAQLAEKVVSRHGSHRAELPVIATSVATLAQELTEHLGKEEAVLFPYIKGLEHAQSTGAGKPRSCFYSVVSPITVMTEEHDSAGALLAELRRLSNDYTPPEGACPTYHGFYTALREFEQDLHQHIHLENNILFPRSLQLEESFLQTA